VFSVHRATITKSGQMSVPAEIRRRWQARSVVIVDNGSHFVVSPAPADPISALRGSLAGVGPTSEEARRTAREEEQEIEDERWERRSGEKPV
jgi:bifunctional DNA-binding transcriptional regulator/antitoxin component of YhaV-PrlF toxin-antitoxin module